MSDFHSYHIVTARKTHRCEHCRKDIVAGEKYRKCAQVWAGDFYAFNEHLECHNAWNKLNFDVRGISHYEGAAFLIEDEHDPDDQEWMREEYPVVADRLGWSVAA